jgi:predicted transcriptional regulator
VSEMKILHIGIASHDEMKRRAIDIAAGRRKRDPSEPRIWMSSLDDVRRILSKKTMLLLEIIRNSQPDSVADLAKRAGRAKSNVSRTLHKLEEFGMVEFEERPGNRMAPRVTFDRFRVEGGFTEHERAA